LISKKLQGQEKLAGGILNNAGAAESIARLREAISAVETIDAIRLLESRAAYAYWGTWHSLAINFPKSDIRRVPDHWRTFKNRVSPLTGSPRLAANPLNAMLNYLYALLESEARIAVAALGLDPGLGILHADTAARDSLACDVMEPVRPMVDAYLLEWVNREVLRREWFFEQRDGSCRLMGEFSAQLSKTAPTWSTALAPFAELVSRILWSTIQKPTRHRPPTRLTQQHRREAKDATSILQDTPPPRPQSFCKQCGVVIGRGRSYCAPCAIKLNTAGLVKAAQLGRVVSHGDQAEGRRAETQRQHAAEKAGWNASEMPAWLTKDAYIREIQPRLKGITLSVVASRLCISIPYAVDVRCGRRVPHARHWQVLAQLVGISHT
jgi:CRISPR/Cas system-associated endonuclease Cas1